MPLLSPSTTLLCAGALFLFGLLFGSFLNVCIARLPAEQSVVKPRSRCPLCEHPISAGDNIPVLSWLLLRGRCRHCQWRIPARYPLVELGTGLWFVASFLRFGLTLAALNCVVFGFFLIGLLVMDWQTHLLPDEFTLGGALVGFLLCCVDAFARPLDTKPLVLTDPEQILLLRVLSIIGAALILLAIRALYKALRKRDGMGLGDVKMLAMIAAFLGFWHAVLALFIAVLAGAVYALGMMILKRGVAAQTRLAFGSFLAVGGLVTAMIGSGILVWYTGFFR